MTHYTSRFISEHERPLYKEMPGELYHLAEVQRYQFFSMTKEAQNNLLKILDKSLSEVNRELFYQEEHWFRAHQLRIINFLAETVRHKAETALATVVKDSYQKMQALAPLHTQEQINFWFKYWGGEARPLDLQSIEFGSRESLIRVKANSIRYWGHQVEQNVRQILTQGQIGRKTFYEVARDLQETVVRRRLTEQQIKASSHTEALDKLMHQHISLLEQGSVMGLGIDLYQAKRIIRTETSYAYNATHLNSLHRARELGISDIQKTCLIVKDSKTAADSLPMNLQIRDLHEPFVDGAGRVFMHPPGRPNDREMEIAYIPEPKDAIYQRLKHQNPLPFETLEKNNDQMTLKLDG